VYRAADVNEELSRLRPPRFLNPDGIVRAYVYYQAYGDSLLKVKTAYNSFVLWGFFFSL